MASESGLVTELLSIWHAHRLELLIFVGFLFAVLRLWLYSKRPAQETKESTSEKSGLITDKVTLLSDTPKESLRQEEHYVPANVQPVSNIRRAPKRVIGVKREQEASKSDEAVIEAFQPLVFYYTLGGSTKTYAQELVIAKLQSQGQTRILAPILYDLTEIDHDEFFLNIPKQEQASGFGNVAFFYALLIPSYDIDTELSNFIEHLNETHNDFRIDTAPLSRLAGYSVFGLGDKVEWRDEKEGFCSQAVEVDKWMAKLTAKKRAFPLGLGDVRSDVTERLSEWTEGLNMVLRDLAAGKGLGEGAPGSGDAVESADELDEGSASEGDDEATNSTTTNGRIVPRRSQTADLEDIKAPIPVDFTTSSRPSKVLTSAPKPMVPESSPTYASLTKQGYTIVGSHSGVKICRWTKSALRGRGSCYKYSFYGIASHLCMEATPSLSCSNKCVFCWRHGTNPVGTTWRWTVDPPELIFQGMKAGHYKKIKMLKGIPGVRAERFSEAMRIRHCALSLVGEPIFYPHINELLAMLHKEHISTFLVCNAQHPDQLATLGPVTQLYVSIDASNKEMLRKIDRPLHRDYWERFLRCMDILKEKRFTHRTVFRLTLVKGFNVEEEAEGYAELVARALPGFVEVKGVTYCGTSTAAGAGLTMQNVPFYEEVVDFVLKLEAALERRGLSYGIGAEHAHSCCILLADRKRFYLAGKDEEGSETTQKHWHTLIDYPAFFRCVESETAFRPEDYTSMQPTPEWAQWGNGGFDPRDQRVDRKGRPKEDAKRPRPVLKDTAAAEQF